MLDYRLSKQELAELRAAHRRTLNVREAYRINAVILLGDGRAAISPDMALRLGAWLGEQRGSRAEVRLAQQMAYDIWRARQKPRPEIARLRAV